MARLRERLSYANLMATVAVFIALGGTAWAVSQLPRDSVGSAQIRRGAVGPSELRRNAVSSRAVRDRSIALRDIAQTARDALRGGTGPAGPKGDPGPAGPPGVVFSAAVSSGCGTPRGNATSCTGPGDNGNTFAVGFSRDVSACQAVATLAKVPGGLVEDPPAGRITVRPEGDRVAVQTFDAGGSPQALPFNLIVVC